MPTLHNLTIWRGADAIEVWRALDSSGNPVNLAGYTLRLVVRNARGTTIVARDLALESGMSARALARANAIYGSTSGCIEFSMTRLETRNLDSNGQTSYEIEPRIGGFQDPPMFYGAISVMGGLNDD